MAIALSVSRARDHAECPQKFAWKYLDKIPAPKADLLEGGALAHEGIEAYLAALVKEQRAKAPELVSEAWLAVERSHQGGVPEHLRSDALAVLHRFAEVYTLNLDQIWRTEEGIALNRLGKQSAWFARDTWLRAKPDLILVDGDLNEITVEDWKTGWTMISESALAEDLQAQTYAMAVVKLIPGLAQRVRVRFWYPRWGKMRQVVFEDLARIVEGTWRLWHAIGEGVEATIARRKFPATPGTGCTTCSYTTLCPAAAAVEQAAITSPERAQEVGARLLAMEAAGKVLREQLKTWVTVHGPVDCNGLRWDHWLSERSEYPMAEVRAVLTAAGVEVDRYLRIDNETLKRIKDVELRERIAALRIDRSRPEFRAKKVVEEEEAA